MSFHLPAKDVVVEPFATRSRTATLPIFAATIFLSAFLLFSVQPMFTKMVLPRLGGTPAVWSVAMVFFQGLLLLGYSYAHLSTKFLSTRVAALAHLGLLAGTFLFALPIGVSNLLGRPAVDHEAFWLLGIFALSVGLPFFAVAGNGPLLQAWFSRSGHAQAADPYFLYGASNLGSFAALLMYPVVIEPFLPLGSQTWVWDIGFVLLAVGIGCSALCLETSATQSSAAVIAINPPHPINGRQRLSWIFLAFVPSGLLVAVTAHIATDVASAPFLWIIPLSLFLLTFVLVFRDRPAIPHHVIALLWPLAAAALCISWNWLGGGFGVSLAVHLSAFFVAAMLCHGELYRRRPEARQLTEFYLWMSFGGVLGGLFTSLISPLIFNGIYEYPILIVLALTCMPAIAPKPLRQTFAELGGVLLFIALFFAVWPIIHQWSWIGSAVAVLAILGATVIWLERKTPLRSASIAAAMFLILGLVADDGAREYVVRSFFGVNRVERSSDGEYRDIVHGNTVHGTSHAFHADGSPVTGRPELLGYYSVGGGYDQAINTVREGHAGTLPRVAIAGLGAGSLICHSKPGEDWSFFEIDPSVIRLARDPQWFHFLSECGPNAAILTGDARLTLADQPKTYDAIILDAFSSDSVPVHLVTQEAFAMYLTKLAPDGAIIANTSNRYIDVGSLVVAAGRKLGLSGAIMPKSYAASMLKSLPKRSFPTEIVVLSRNPDVVAKLLSKSGWEPLKDTGTVAWTDDFSNVLGAMLRKK